MAVAETTATEMGYLHGVTSGVQGQLNSLNSNLANVSGTVSGHTNSINSLNSANSARYTENGRINVYVGSDSKLHFVNRDGADTALNFSGEWVPIWIVNAETSYWGVESNPIKRSFANAYSEVILCLTWTRTRVLSVSGATIETYTGSTTEARAASNLDIMLLKDVSVGTTVTYGAAHNDGDGADILVAFGRRK